MSDTTLTEVDPFNPTTLDEETELRALARALEYSEGFKLIFVRCNQPQQRECLADELQKRLPKLKIQKIHFSEPVPHLLDALREHITTTTQDVVFVSGIEYSLPVAAEAHAAPFVANLNASRNSFPQVVNRPLVLWLPEYVLSAITIGAPDFFSIRSGVYFFAATLNEAFAAASGLMTGGGSGTADLTLAEKQERIAAILSLLADYEVLPSNYSNNRIKAQLHSQVGRLFFSVGDYNQALQHYQLTQRLAEQLQDLYLQGLAFNDLGSIYHVQMHLDEAETSYKCSLKKFDEDDHQLAVAVALTNLGDVYLQQGKFGEAEENYRRGLAIFRQSKDRVREAQALNGLGNIYIGQEKMEEAEEYFRHSLAISDEMGRAVIKAISLGGLGMAYLFQGRLAEAEKSYKQSLSIFRELGDILNEATTLNHLGILSSRQGQLEQAEKFYQESLAVSHRINDRAGEERVLRNLSALAEQKNEEPTTKEQG